MWSSVELRAQVASVIDALSKTAVAEIAKVLEDGVAVLRLEICRRESEVKALRSNVEALHGELRSVRSRAGGKDRQAGRTHLAQVHVLPALCSVLGWAAGHVDKASMETCSCIN